MKLSRATIALYMGLVFVSGATLGIFGNRYYDATTATNIRNRGKRPPSPEEFRKMYLNEMQKQLGLSTKQITKLSSIMDETRALLDELHKRAVPERQEIDRSQNEKIRSVFDPIQRQKYDEMMQRMAEQSKANKNKGQRRGGF
ncbi:MAG: hypothetical protein ABI811_17465 [Acidobacteriota bacterium]